ncbi:DHS-like NAD/FAD-binding domain-containing protein, partial [Rhodotorula sp. JG-1b]
MATAPTPTPTPLSVLSFGSAPPPAVAPLPAGVSLNLVDAQQPSTATVHPETPPINLAHVARTVLKAKRVAVVCGAGISTASGIPDFRSGAGLFESLKKQYPDAKLSSGKDLFDVGLFASESNAAIFFNMIAELKKQTDAVEPTAFHSWLKQLDDDGKLFRVYTQNIDALEEKAGLTYGLGDKSLPLPPRRKGTAAPPPRSPSKSSTTTTTRTSTPLPPPLLSSSASVPLEPTSSQASIASSSPSPSSSSTTPPPPPPPPPPTHSAIPRVIPLHGHLSTLSCSACKHEVPLSGAYVDLLSTGSAPLCPACLSIEEARSAAGERSRGVGMMRPDVVLYGEEHKDGERVGAITQRDLMGQRPDLLIVVGTTLKVKGTKRLVRELAKVIRPPQQQAPPPPPPSSSGRDEDSSSATLPSKPLRKRRAPPPRPPPIHTLYLNYDFPTPSKEWAGVFDCWLRGDIQEFVEAVKREEEVLKREQEGRERKRDE